MKSEILNLDDFLPLVRTALREDLADKGDVTTMQVVPLECPATGRIFSRQKGVAAGLLVAEAVFREVDPGIAVEYVVADGAQVEDGDDLLRFSGPARGILVAERTALNFLGRLSGVATMTRRCVDLVKHTGAKVLDTRKTTPGLRRLEKYAVALGGGQNHRQGLYDQVLLKENHFALAEDGGGLDGYRRTVVKAGQSGLLVEAEARDQEQTMAAIEGGAGIVLLDNMSPAKMKSAVEQGRRLAMKNNRQVLFEASGGITLDNLALVAETGVDRISMGALTHSVEPLDLSLLIDNVC